MSEDTNYEKLEGRLKSFEDWTFATDPQKLANAGFYATGYHDVVRCFACGLGLRYMKPEDDPLIEHSKHGPTTCHFLIQMCDNTQQKETDENGATNSTNGESDEMDELSRLEEQNTQLRARTTCKVCRERQALILLIPCSHLATCVQCEQNLTICPVCNRQVVETVKTFLG
ncbi:baculoviral IAP repeat-containing protein 8-like [Mya arenaria]|uniref:baculoviral IAP repeat-containing protein 8-like n=1 Tax=Mya arenaria TaxID=6604 RepID=UPI0022E0C9E6|nr:baculoviral IAP repeat-containing protein 8-like [Mya arenaria]XP_052809875.1 baculoviral IAP repeat-containing protein 8-like [Mya arenaria]